jgi:transposase
MARRTYNREFKLQAVQLMAERGLSVAEASRQLGVSENCLRAWRQAARDLGDGAFPGQGKPPAAEEELRRLRAEVVRLRAERDLLKKAAAYFASPPS